MPERYRVEKWREVYSPNAAMLRFTMERDGYRVYQWCDRPGTFYGPHKHEEDQSHWVISGKLEITVKGGGVHHLTAGDRDFMPAQTYHAAEVIGYEPVIYLVGEKLPVKKKRGRPRKVK